jgi:hypothetical protein
MMPVENDKLRHERTYPICGTRRKRRNMRTEFVVGRSLISTHIHFFIDNAPEYKDAYNGKDTVRLHLSEELPMTGNTCM